MEPLLTVTSRASSGQDFFVFPMTRVTSYFMMDVFCKTCGGKNFLRCEECGPDNTEVIYPTFDENGNLGPQTLGKKGW